LVVPIQQNGKSFSDWNLSPQLAISSVEPLFGSFLNRVGLSVANSRTTIPIQFTDQQTSFKMEESMAKAAGKTKANSAFMKPMQPSEDLAKIVGSQPLPRSEVTKKIWAHIKKNKLQNPTNKREILADEKLQPIFGSKKLDMFQMTKAVNKHLK
jgi:chromatin remodeling complex protein RSC6